MAAARGDADWRPGSVFTVHSENCSPVPCSDGLNLSYSRAGPLSSSSRRNILFYSKDILTFESSDELNRLSKDESRDDVLTDVQIHRPICGTSGVHGEDSNNKYPQHVSY